MSRSYYRTRIKFCGMTRAGDVRLAGELGVDAVGFIFARESSRRVAPAEARAMRRAIAPMVDVVALFRNNSKEEVREVLRTVRPTLLQFHGEEDESFCRSFNMPYLKAIAMGGAKRSMPAPCNCVIPALPASCSTATRRVAVAAPAWRSTGAASRPDCIGRSCWPVA